MMVPGSNLLSLALSVIGPQLVKHERFIERETRANGLEVSTYDRAKDIEGSVQSVDRKLYERLGLDVRRNYVLLYTVYPIQDVQRDGAGDRITYNGVVFQCESALDWMAQDDWNCILCVQIPATRKPIAKEA